MNILFRYILFQFLRLALICQAAALTLFLIVDFIERIDDLIEKNAALSDAVFFFLYKIPQLLFLSIPLTVLLACVMSLILLSRGNEIVAMRAAGVSILLIVAPILLASMGIGAVSFFANEYIIPYTNQRMNHIWYIKIKKYEARAYNRKWKIWYRSKNNFIWQIAFFNTYKDTMRNVTLYQLDDNDRLIRRIDAVRVTWVPKENRWRFNQGLIHRFGEGGSIRQEPFQVAYFPLIDRPIDFKKTGKDPNEMNWEELQDYIETLQTNGVDTTAYVVDLWAKISTPFVSFVLALVGVPFSLKSSRTGGLALAVTTTIAIGVGYLLLYYVGISLGHSGRLPPLIAAWGANAIFLGGGVYMLTLVRS